MINEEQLYQLEQNLHQQRIAVDRQQLNDFFLLDDEFHQKLSIIADCQLAWEALEKAMSIHLHEISESVLLIRQENRDWFSEE